MIALDTNVIVRLMTGDDPAQSRSAAERVRGEELWLGKTVLLETEWVLRHAYEFSAASVQAALKTLLGLRNLRVEDRTSERGR